MKRYAYWLKPTGRIAPSADDKSALPSILAQFGLESTLNPDNTVSWPGGIYSRLITTLSTAVVIRGLDGQDLNDIDAGKILIGAIQAVIRQNGDKKAIIAGAFINAADKIVSEFFRKPLVRYSVVTTLSIEGFPKNSIRIKGSKITPLQNRGHFRIPADVESDVPAVFATDRKQHYQLIKVDVDAPSSTMALALAIRRLNILRGLWTLIGNYGKWLMSFGLGSPHLLATIHLGPLYTLHERRGQNVNGAFWVDDDQTGEERLFLPSKGWPEMEKRRVRLTKIIARLPYALDFEDVLCKYVEALDQRNLDVAFIYMWGILERITDTVALNYDETIRRTVWPLVDRKLASEMLGTLRLHRNRFVHAGASRAGRDQICYLLKSFVEPHLLRLIRNDLKIKSFQEYGNQLATSTDVTALKAERNRINHALRLFSRKDG